MTKLDVLRIFAQSNGFLKPDSVRLKLHPLPIVAPSIAILAASKVRVYSNEIRTPGAAICPIGLPKGDAPGLNTCGGNSRTPPNVTYVRNDSSLAPESWFGISGRFPTSRPKITLQCRIPCRLRPTRALDNRTSTLCSIPAER